MHAQLDHRFGATSLSELDVVDSVSRCLTPQLEELRGRRIIFSRDDTKLFPVDGWGLRTMLHPRVVTTVRPVNENTIVAAVDSSCIELAETEEGSLYAAKCGIATAFGGRSFMHFKIGPVLFYMGESTAHRSDLDDKVAKAVLVDTDLAKRLVRVRAERAVQNELAGHLHNSIILVDGSLKGTLFEERERSVKKISEMCSLRKNAIIGISKGTKLKALERAAAPLLKVAGPAYIDVDNLVKSLVRNAAGLSLMVRLAASSPALRTDIIGSGHDEILGKLIYNDSVAGGYPETLRLAHCISTFTSTEVTCLRGHVLNNYGVTELASEDIRKTLFGSIPV